MSDETWEEFWNRTQAAEHGTWAEVTARVKPGEFIETNLSPEQLRRMPVQPECPYWSDGKHCYEVDHEGALPDLRPGLSSVYHWRRHPGSVTCDTQWTTGELQGETVVASACGRLVEYQQAMGDPENADCVECLELHGLVLAGRLWWLKADSVTKANEP